MNRIKSLILKTSVFVVAVSAVLAGGYFANNNHGVSATNCDPLVSRSKEIMEKGKKASISSSSPRTPTTCTYSSLYFYTDEDDYYGNELFTTYYNYSNNTVSGRTSLYGQETTFTWFGGLLSVKYTPDAIEPVLEIKAAGSSKVIDMNDVDGYDGAPFLVCQHTDGSLYPKIIVDGELYFKNFGPYFVNDTVSESTNNSITISGKNSTGMDSLYVESCDKINALAKTALITTRCLSISNCNLVVNDLRDFRSNNSSSTLYSLYCGYSQGSTESAPTISANSAFYYRFGGFKNDNDLVYIFETNVNVAFFADVKGLLYVEGGENVYPICKNVKSDSGPEVIPNPYSCWVSSGSKPMMVSSSKTIEANSYFYSPSAQNTSLVLKKTSFYSTSNYNRYNLAIPSDDSTYVFARTAIFCGASQKVSFFSAPNYSYLNRDANAFSPVAPTKLSTDNKITLAPGDPLYSNLFGSFTGAYGDYNVSTDYKLFDKAAGESGRSEIVRTTAKSASVSCYIDIISQNKLENADGVIANLHMNQWTGSETRDSGTCAADFLTVKNILETDDDKVALKHNLRTLSEYADAYARLKAWAKDQGYSINEKDESYTNKTYSFNPSSTSGTVSSFTIEELASSTVVVNSSVSTGNNSIYIIIAASIVAVAAFTVIMVVSEKNKRKNASK